MPTPSADWQCSIDDFLMGAGTSFPLGRELIDGLGNPPAKTSDFQTDGDHGVVPGPDYLSPRTLIVHLEVWGDTPDEAFSNLVDLKQAWMPVQVGTVEFHMQLPGWGHVVFDGRPRGLEVFDMKLARAGRMQALGEFLATDPVQHAP